MICHYKKNMTQSNLGQEFSWLTPLYDSSSSKVVDMFLPMQRPDQAWLKADKYKFMDIAPGWDYQS